MTLQIHKAMKQFLPRRTSSAEHQAQDMADVKNITENKIFEEIIKTKNMISLGEEIPLCKVATTSDLQEMESNFTNILSSQFSLIHRRLEEVSNVHKTTYPENTIENLTEHPNNTLENDHLGSNLIKVKK